MLDLNLTSLTHGLIDLKSRAPDAFSSLLVPDSAVNYAEGKYGRLMLQEVEANPFSILYNVYHIKHRFLLQVKSDTPLLVLHILLKNDMHYHLNGIGDLYLKEGQFNIVYLPQVDVTSFFEQEGEYRTFNVYLPVTLLQQYAQVFPYLNEFLEKIAGSMSAFLLKKHGWIDSEISRIINKVLQCSYDETVRVVYFDNLLRELLLLLLQNQRQEINYTTGSQQFMESLYAVRSIIEKIPPRSIRSNNSPSREVSAK